MNIDKVVIHVGRALIALLFVMAGVSKILDPRIYLDHMAEFGVPALLLPPVIALEICGGLAILIGWRLRDTAGALGAFCILTAVIFHHQIGIKVERTQFVKDLALAGGLLVMAASAEATRRARTAALANA